MSYSNENKGVLFKNNDKESDKHPDYKGNIDVNGEEFWLSAWINESKKGTKYMSLSVSPKQKAQEQMQKTKDFYESNQDDIPGFDDSQDIPF
jgi:uncharacterized protein (DUF736 family)